MSYQHFLECDMCRGPFRFSNGRYEGRPVKSWGVNLCNSCTGGNWDGIVPNQHPHFIEKLIANGVDIQLNEKGWLPIPPRGS